MELNIKLNTDAAKSYATYHGFTDDSGVDLQDFVTDKILERFTNDVIEFNNRQALAGVTRVVDVTSDGSMTVLRDKISKNRVAKQEKPLNEPVIIEDIKQMGVKDGQSN